MNVPKDFIFGLLCAYVPIMAMSTVFETSLEKNGFNYIDIIRYTPIMFGFLNALFMAIFRKLDIKSFIIIGIIFSIIYSSIGRFIFDVPTKLFEMKNPNMFHVYALITWTLVYGILGNFYYNFS